MAAPTNTATTISQVGNREDLTDVISRVAPEKTPFTTNCGKMGKAKAVDHEWQLETLAAPSATNAQLEGDDTTSFEENVTVRVKNKCQIFKKSFVVSGTQEVVDKAGRASEIKRQSVLKGIEMKRDREAAFLSANPSRAESGSTPRLLGGIQSWIETNTSRGGNGGADGGYNISTGIVDAPTAGDARPFTETMVKDVMQSIFDESGDQSDKVMYLDSFNKRVFSSFSGISETRTAANAGMATIIGAADVYQSDFGRISTVPVAYGLSGTALIIDHAYAGAASLRGTKRQKLALSGDNEKYQMICEDTFVCKNEKAHGLIADLTTA